MKASQWRLMMRSMSPAFGAMMYAKRARSMRPPPSTAAAAAAAADDEEEEDAGAAADVAAAGTRGRLPREERLTPADDVADAGKNAEVAAVDVAPVLLLPLLLLLLLAAVVATAPGALITSSSRRLTSSRRTSEKLIPLSRSVSSN